MNMPPLSDEDRALAVRAGVAPDPQALELEAQLIAQSDNDGPQPADELEHGG